MTRTARLSSASAVPLLICIAVVAMLGSFMVGKYHIDPGTVIDIIRSRFMPVDPYWEPTIATVVWEVRLPQIVSGFLVGGALSVSGASYQTLFKNPMVSSDILGVSAGAGFGAALAMLNQADWWQIQLAAFCGGVIAVAVAYAISALFGNRNNTVLVLAGIVVSSFCTALISIVKTLADTDNALPSITFWLMGSLGKTSMRDLIVIIPAVVMSLALLYLFRHRIDVLVSGNDEAQSMGVSIVST